MMSSLTYQDLLLKNYLDKLKNLKKLNFKKIYE